MPIHDRKTKKPLLIRCVRLMTGKETSMIKTGIVWLLLMAVGFTACSEKERKQDITSEPSASQVQMAETDAGSETLTAKADIITSEKEKSAEMIYAYTGKAVLEIEPADNSSAEAFIFLLEEGDITVKMHDYGSFEKVGSLDRRLPTNNEQITTEPGDVILYQGNQITIYYDTNTWNFTRLGKVIDLSRKELTDALGDGDVTVVFSLSRDSWADADSQ